jgi:hypothetical protein
MLEDIVKTAFNLITPGGRFVGIGCNPALTIEDFPYLEKYGVFVRCVDSNKGTFDDGD